MKTKLFCIIAGVAMAALASCGKDSLTPVEYDTPVEMDEFADVTLPGTFSVSPRVKVQFSRGNLQHLQAQDVWAFAENQYDIAEGNTSIASPGACDWIDLFGWSTGATYYGVSASTDDDDYRGDFVDWGTVFGEKSPWRTLSADEWYFLFKSRYNADDMCGLGRVQLEDGRFVNGFIVLSDDFVLPSDCSFRGTYSGSGNYTRNTFTIAQWREMEAAGAVFLPSAACRNGTVLPDSVLNKWNGYYWHSTPGGERTSFGICFGEAGRDPIGDLYDRHLGLSVRLVRRAK